MRKRNMDHGFVLAKRISLEKATLHSDWKNKHILSHTHIFNFPTQAITCPHSHSPLCKAFLAGPPAPAWAVQPRAPNQLHCVHQMPIFCYRSTQYMHSTNADRFAGSPKPPWSLVHDASCLPGQGGTLFQLMVVLSHCAAPKPPAPHAQSFLVRLCT
jgi:hypothetical protein